VTAKIISAMLLCACLISCDQPRVSPPARALLAYTPSPTPTATVAQTPTPTATRRVTMSDIYDQVIKDADVVLARCRAEREADAVEMARRRAQVTPTPSATPFKIEYDQTLCCDGWGKELATPDEDDGD
jgi:hypothetical protein